MAAKITVPTVDLSGIPKLDSLPDVSLSTLTDGDLLTYDSATATWENSPAVSGISELSDIPDVSLVDLANGEALKYNSSTTKWENGVVGEDISSGALSAPWAMSQHVHQDSGNVSGDVTNVRWDDNLDLVADRERPLGTIQETIKLAEQINAPLTVTVKSSGGDFTTIQTAWDYFTNKVINAAVTIQVDAGSWNEAGLILTFNPFGGRVTVSGDTRADAGKIMTATGNLTKNGNDCTITLTEAVPSGWGAGDYVTICGAFTSAGNVGRFPIVSVDSGAKTITYTNASGVAEATLSGVGFAVLNPNVIITRTTDGNTVHKGASANFTGVTLLNAAASGVLLNFSTTDPGPLNLTKTHCYGSPNSGILARRSTLGLSATVSVVKCAYEGVYGTSSSLIWGYGSFLANNWAGIASMDHSTVYADSSRSIKNTFGYRCLGKSYLYADSSTSKYNATTGYHAEKCSYISAVSTVANCASNGANFSPASSDTVGNVGSYITFS